MTVPLSLFLMVFWALIAVCIAWYTTIMLWEAEMDYGIVNIVAIIAYIIYALAIGAAETMFLLNYAAQC